MEVEGRLVHHEVVRDVDLRLRGVEDGGPRLGVGRRKRFNVLNTGRVRLNFATNTWMRDTCMQLWRV